ncbi:MAG: DUF393 domain-containing protein [Cryobacterium sp.]|nr:DUF393 domain-containing protein [Oligoflexia bacterium]
MDQKTPLRILYDGGCRVCAWEVEKYQKADPHGRLLLTDINAPNFDAGRYGLDANQVRKYFHVMTPDGKVIAGVDAFIEIWETLATPFSLRAARLARLSPVHGLMELGYAGFVLVRPFLPRRSGRICDDGSCDYR